MNKKVITCIIFGFFLLYNGLSDDNFILFYHGIAVVASFTLFVLAYIEWKKEKEKNKP